MRNSINTNQYENKKPSDRSEREHMRKSTKKLKIKNTIAWNKLTLREKYSFLLKHNKHKVGSYFSNKEAMSDSKYFDFCIINDPDYQYLSEYVRENLIDQVL